MDCLKELNVDFSKVALCPKCDTLYDKYDLIPSVLTVAMSYVSKDDNIEFYLCPNCYHLLCIFL